MRARFGPRTGPSMVAAFIIGGFRVVRAALGFMGPGRHRRRGAVFAYMLIFGSRRGPLLARWGGRGRRPPACRACRDATLGENVRVHGPANVRAGGPPRIETVVVVQPPAPPGRGRRSVAAGGPSTWPCLTTPPEPGSRAVSRGGGACRSAGWFPEGGREARNPSPSRARWRHARSRRKTVRPDRRQLGARQWNLWELEHAIDAARSGDDGSCARRGAGSSGSCTSASSPTPTGVWPIDFDGSFTRSVRGELRGEPGIRIRRAREEGLWRRPAASSPSPVALALTQKSRQSSSPPAAGRRLVTRPALPRRMPRSSRHKSKEAAWA